MELVDVHLLGEFMAQIKVEISREIDFRKKLKSAIEGRTDSGHQSPITFRAFEFFDEEGFLKCDIDEMEWETLARSQHLKVTLSYLYFWFTGANTNLDK